jgi:hypothetical protein
MSRAKGDTAVPKSTKSVRQKSKKQARKASTKNTEAKRPLVAATAAAKPVGTKKRRGVAGPPIAPPTGAVGATPGAAAGIVLTWEDDPLSTPARQPIQVATPTLPAGQLPIRIVDAAPPAQVHPQGTSRFRYWVAAEALERGMRFWSRFIPGGTTWATPDRQLRVHLDKGPDLNAYYRRGTSTLEFFHSTVGGRTVFSGESPNVVCHELGHAILDALRPQLFHTFSVEIAAFHEAFGDISAILCVLQLNSAAQEILTTTGGRLYHSTFLSRVAEELGWGIRQIRPQSVEPDCLRNAVNSFFYRDPATLPPAAPASLLSSAPHSFSRVFTAAFYDAFAGMVTTDNASPTVQSVQRVTRDAARLLVDAIRNAPIVPNYFSQLAAQMIAADQARFARKYREVLKGAFVRHGILSLEAAAGIVGPSAPVAVLGMADTGAVAGTTTELPLVAVSAPSLGINAHTVLCGAPSEGGGYAAAAASATDTGSLAPPSHTDAVRSFLEDLLRLGRVDLSEQGDPNTRIAQPNIRKTHVLQETPAGLTVLRETFDCGFDYV